MQRSFIFYLFFSTFFVKGMEHQLVDSTNKPLGLSEIDLLLHRAAAGGDVQACEQLMAQGARVNSINNGMTVLHAAAKGGQGLVTKMLITKHLGKLDLNAKDLFGDTPLLVALKSYTQPDVFDCFITQRDEYQSYMEEFRPQGETSYYRSLERGEPHFEKKVQAAFIAFGERCYDSVIVFLVEAGCNIFASNCKGRNALYYALKRCKLKALNVLMPKLSLRENFRIMHYIKAYAEQSKHNFSYDDLAVEACYRSCDYILEKLLSDASKVVIIDRMNLMHVATENNDLSMVRNLISKGASIHKKGNKGETPLHCASIMGDRLMIELLLTAGAKINEEDSAGNTALHIVSSRGYLENVILLCEKGAKIWLNNKDRLTPFHLAARYGHIDIVKYFFSSFQSYVAIRAEQNDVATANKTVKQKKKRENPLQSLCRKGMIPLHYACFSGSAPMVQFLIDAESEVNVCDKEGNTPLHLACVIGNSTIVKILLEAGSRVDVRNKKGFSPLLCVAGHREEGERTRDVMVIIDLLLTYGADVNVIADDTWTPLLLAASAKNLVIARKLTDAGALLDPVNSEGLSLIHIAIKQGGASCSETVKILSEMEKVKLDDALSQSTYGNISRLNKEPSYIGPSPSYFWAVDRGMKDVVKVLLDTGIDINMRDRTGWTSLHRAVDTPTDTSVQFERQSMQAYEKRVSLSLDLIALLIDRGAHIDAIDDQHMTPLHLACRNLERSVITLLLEKGADVRKIAKNGYSCLHFVFFNANLILMEGGREKRALLRSSFDNLSERTVTPIVKLLVKAGCDINGVSADGSTPLHWAVRAGLRNPVLALLGAGAKIDAKNIHEKTPLDEALDNKDTEFGDLLRAGHTCSKGCSKYKCEDEQALSAMIGIMKHSLQNSSEDSSDEKK